MPAVIIDHVRNYPHNRRNDGAPETAMIMSPEISLALSGYSFTVKEKINGKILEADKTDQKHKI